VEENRKRMHSFEYDLNINKKEIATIKENIEQLKKSDKDLESLIQKKNELLNARIDENKKNLEKITNNISDLNSLCSNLKNDMDLIHKELQSTIANDFQNSSSGKDFALEGNNQKGDNTSLLIKTVNDNILLSSTLTDIQNEQKNFKEFIERYNQEKEEIDNEFEKNENDISDLQSEISSIKKEIKLFFSSFNGEEKKKFNLDELDLSNYVTNEMHKKLSDNIRIISSSLGSIPKREEFEKELRKINARLETIELIQQGVTSGPRTMINSELVQKDGEKMNSQKLILSSKEEGKDKTVTNIKKMIINTINEETKNINFGENAKILEILKNMKKCEEDISKNYTSIIDIRNILTTSPNQNDLITLKGDIERLSEESKKKFVEILRSLNGDEEEESEEEDDK
jgi:predicted nuclease with TOPRIM domain